jgi:hypothetical protein
MHGGNVGLDRIEKPYELLMAMALHAATDDLAFAARDVVRDNYATHKHAKVRAWLDRHPRFVFHYTPTSASWLNAVEGFFAKLTKRRLKRGVFRSIVDLQVAINGFLEETNDDPKPFVWTADPIKSSLPSDVGTKR